MPERNDQDTLVENRPGDDWGLVDHVRAGNDSAFEELMARYKRPVLNFIFRLIGNATEAEDVAQEVFVRAYRAMHTWAFRRTTAEFSTWLFQVARNAALDCLRRRRRCPTLQLSAIEGGGKPLLTEQATPAKAILAREIGAAIAAAIAALPEDQRTAVILSEYEGLSDAQVAEVMRCSTKSVESRLYRARRFLRARLSDWL